MYRKSSGDLSRSAYMQSSSGNGMPIFPFSKGAVVDDLAEPHADAKRSDFAATRHEAEQT